MSENQAPRPATELFPESLNLSPKQRSVLDTLSSYPQGAKVVDLAGDLGMHINTARGHLDELVERGAVLAVPTSASGRGRPSLIYSLRIPDNRAVASEYLTLIEVMATHLSELEPEAACEMAIAVGRRWGQRMKEEGYSTSDMESSVDSLFKHLREMGFDPQREEPCRSSDAADDALEQAAVNVSMRSCPFISSRHRPSMFLCLIHQGMLSMFVDNPLVNLTLKPFTQPGYCSIAITEKRGA